MNLIKCGQFQTHKNNVYRFFVKSVLYFKNINLKTIYKTLN